MRTPRLFLVVILTCVIGCGGEASSPPPTAADAARFLKDVDEQLLQLGISLNQAGWVQQNFITDDTEALNARANQAFIEAVARFAKEAAQFHGLELPADQRRQLDLLKLSLVMATPGDPKEATELTTIAARMDGAYGKGKWCPDPKNADTLPRHRRHHRDHGEQPRPEAAARGLGGLAHDLAADAEGLPALRRAVEQGRQRARLRRHRRDVALEVRHAARRVRRRSSIACGNRCGRSTSRCTPTCA